MHLIWLDNHNVGQCSRKTIQKRKDTEFSLMLNAQGLYFIINGIICALLSILSTYLLSL